MSIAGIDLGGRKIAISKFLNGELIGVYDLEVSKDWPRNKQLREMGQWADLMTRLSTHVFIEEPLIGRGVRASMQISQTAGAVMAYLQPHRPTYLVPVATWKKEVVGKGNASKDDVKDWLKSSHPDYAALCGTSQDRTDATCIGLYGRAVVRRSRELGEL